MHITVFLSGMDLDFENYYFHILEIIHMEYKFNFFFFAPYMLMLKFKYGK